MVGLGRVELPTSPVSGVRSSHLSYRPMGFRTGGAGRDRTGDLLNANQALSQLSYSPYFLVPGFSFLGSRWRHSTTRNQKRETRNRFFSEADWMLPDGTRPNRQNNIRELSSGDPRRIWTGKAVTYYD